MDRLQSCFWTGAVVCLTIVLLCGPAEAFNENLFKSVLNRYSDASLLEMPTAQMDAHARELLLWSKVAFREAGLSNGSKLQYMKTVEDRLEALKDISKLRQAQDGEKADSGNIDKTLNENRKLINLVEAQSE